MTLPKLDDIQSSSFGKARNRLQNTKQNINSYNPKLHGIRYVVRKSQPRGSDAAN